MTNSADEDAPLVHYKNTPEETHCTHCGVLLGPEHIVRDVTYWTECDDPCLKPKVSATQGIDPSHPAPYSSGKSVIAEAFGLPQPREYKGRMSVITGSHSTGLKARQHEPWCGLIDSHVPRCTCNEVPADWYEAVIRHFIPGAVFPEVSPRTVMVHPANMKGNFQQGMDHVHTHYEKLLKETIIPLLRDALVIAPVVGHDQPIIMRLKAGLMRLMPKAVRIEDKGGVSMQMVNELPFPVWVEVHERGKHLCSLYVRPDTENLPRHYFRKGRYTLNVKPDDAS